MNATRSCYVLTGTALMAVFLHFPNTSRAETIGSALANRGSVDGALGLIFTNPGAMTFSGSGSVLSWEMFAGKGTPEVIGRQITPLVFDQNSVLTGIGATRTIAATGLNSFDFGLVDGTDAVGDGSVFGWRDGAATGAGNAGTISLQSAGGPRTNVVARVGMDPGDAVVGSTYDQLVHTNLPRYYSIQATTDAASSVITPAFATGTPHDHGGTSWLINGNAVPSGQGLSGTGPVLAQEHVTSHMYGWLKNNQDPANELIFSWPVGEAADLTAVHIWQYTQGCCTNRGIDTFDMSFSTDGGANYSVPLPISLAEAAGGAVNEISQTRAFAAQTGVTHVKFNNMTPFAPDAQGSWQGLNEVRFQGVVNPIPPYEPPASSSPVGNDLTNRQNTTDTSAAVFYTNYVPMPDDGAVDSVSVFFQGSNLPFELFQLRPTGTPDQYDVIYRSGNIVPFGMAEADQIESFALDGGPIGVEAGDIFAHYGQGIPFSISAGGNQHHIFYNATPPPVEAPQVNDVLTLNDAGVGTTFPVFAQMRDYAMAVNFTPVPEPGSVVLAALGVLGLAIGMRRRRERS